MKFLRLTIVAAGALLLSACNFSLASDITPPPDYVSPTPMPTLGALVPAAPPDVQQGAQIFTANCVACHGAKGLGDGPQSMQLPVTVPGIGLPAVAEGASPAEWYKIVTQGNLDRFMPPFASALSDQQRWDVVAYALTLHMSDQQVAEGKQLFEQKCPGCAANFSDQARMAPLSENDVVNLIRNGEGSLPAFGKDLSDEQAHSVAVYLRTLTFAGGLELASGPTATPAAPTASTQAATPAAGTAVAETPVAGTAEAVTPAANGTIPAPGPGTVTGSIQMATSGQVPANLSVTLHGYDHGQDQTTGPQEVLTLSGTAAPDGTFTFQNVEMPVNRIFLAEVNYNGLQYRSGFEAAQANSTTITLSPVKIYEKSEDFSLLKLSQVHIYTDFATAGTAQVLEIFAFTNSSDKAVVISNDGSTIPFIKLPAQAQDVGYEAGQDSAPFTAADKGLAVVPSTTPYSIIAFFSMPYEKSLDISQPFAMDAPSVVLLIPDGMKVTGKQLADKGPQVIQNNNYHEYGSSEIKAGQTLQFSISGSPRTSSATGLDSRQITMIAGASLGLLLILAGAVLYLRDRKRLAATPEGLGFDSADAVMDAILALDDLHRAGKISKEAYQSRREELKGILRDMQ